MCTRPPRPDPGAQDPRLALEPAMAERVHRVAREAAERLGCLDPFVLFLTPRADRLQPAAAMLQRAVLRRVQGSAL